MGIRYDFNWSGLRSTPIFKWLLVAAWAIVIGSFLYRFSFFLSSRFQFDLDRFHLSGITYVHMKENLSAVRLLHFLSVALLVATYVSSSNPIFRWFGADIVTRTGRCSLEVFSVSAILSVVLSIIVVVYHPSVLEKLGLDGIAILLIALTAFALSEFRSKRKRAIGPMMSSP
jgi:OpgC protein